MWGGGTLKKIIQDEKMEFEIYRIWSWCKLASSVPTPAPTYMQCYICKFQKRERHLHALKLIVWHRRWGELCNFALYFACSKSRMQFVTTAYMTSIFELFSNDTAAFTLSHFKLCIVCICASHQNCIFSIWKGTKCEEMRMLEILFGFHIMSCIAV